MDARTTPAGIVILAVLLLLPAPASAQVYTGRVDVRVHDASGAVLPGVTVDLSGGLAQTASTNSIGEAHFLNLPAGRYRVSASLSGFTTYASSTFDVEAGAAVPLRITLDVAGVTEQVVVSGEAPLIDARKQATGLTMPRQELEQIPTSREWSSLAQSVPTVLVDRVNVGGSESGVQSNLFAKGASSLQNTASLDGVVVTDAAVGIGMANPDFDLLQEVRVTTGGATIPNPTAGVQMNLVLKSGSDVPHGSAHFYFETESLQANNLTPGLQAQLNTRRGNRMDHLTDYAFEMGGPIVKDKLWVWGGASKLDMATVTIGDYPSPSLISNVALKASWQPASRVRGSFTYLRGRFEELAYGAGPTNPPDATLHVRIPNDLYKAEGNLAVGSSLFLTGRVSYMWVREDYTPNSGLGHDVWRDVGGVWHGGFFYGLSSRPQTAAALDGSFFRGRHELSFGFSWRKAPTDWMETISSANGIYTVDLPSYASNGAMLAYVRREWRSITDGRFAGGYFGDTVTFDRATLTAAVRWDHSSASILPATAQGVPGFEQFLPTVTTPAVPDAIVYSLPSPRVGISYQPGRDRKTQVRGSYARLPMQLKTLDVKVLTGLSMLLYYAVDRNRDGAAQPGEFVIGPVIKQGFDPANPSDTMVGRIDPTLGTPYAHEMVVGIDRELRTSVSVSASYTYRRYVDMAWTPLVGVRAPDYAAASVLSGTLFGEPYSVQNYTLPDQLLPPGLGMELVNRAGYHQAYHGLEVLAAKRWDGRWMARLGFSTNTHREYFDDPAASIQDPTPDPASPNVNGGEVVFATPKTSIGAITNYVVQPRYQFIANGVGEGPWGMQVAANLIVRQGYAVPYYIGNVGGIVPGRFPPTKNVMVTTAVDEYRLPAVVAADLRVQKTIRLPGDSRAIVSLDVFNLFNSATVLARQPDLTLTGPTGFNAVQEVMSPRIARLGLRFTF